MKKLIKDKIRIIFTLTQKDLTDGIKNKNVLSILISCLFIVIIYKYLPGLYSSDSPPDLLVYSPAEFNCLTLLDDSSAWNLQPYDSQEDMLYALTNEEVPALALILTENIEGHEEQFLPLEIQGYALHFFKDTQIIDLKRKVELEIESLFDRPVNIEVERIQIQPDTYGITVLTGLGFTFVTLMVGMIVIPHMMIEEKQTNTLAPLSISPATRNYRLIARCLTGLIFILGILLITLLFNWVLVSQSWLFILGGILGGLFSISLGILLGTTIHTRQQLTLWAWVVIIPLMIPMVLVMLDDLLPTRLVRILSWFPSSALLRLYRLSMASSAPFEVITPYLGLLFGSTVIVVLIDIYLIRRLNLD